MPFFVAFPQSHPVTLSTCCPPTTGYTVVTHCNNHKSQAFVFGSGLIALFETLATDLTMAITLFPQNCRICKFVELCYTMLNLFGKCFPNSY